MTIAYDKQAAAKALCLSEKEFSELVENGDLPQPRMLGKHPRWDATLLQKIVTGQVVDGMEGTQW